MTNCVIRFASVAGLVFASAMIEARAQANDAAQQFTALAADLGQSQKREDIVRVGNDLIDFSASLTDRQLDALPTTEVEALMSMPGRELPPRELLATLALGELGRRAAGALPELHRLGWEGPGIVCEKDEVGCVRSGPPYYSIYMAAFESIRADMVAHGQELPESLERGNDVRIRQGIERVLAEHDATAAHLKMEELAERATMLPESAMDRLEDSTIDSLAALLDAEPGIRFEAAQILGHARSRAARALPALERAMKASIDVPTKWHLNGAPEPIPGDDYIEEVIQDVSASP